MNKQFNTPSTSKKPSGFFLYRTLLLKDLHHEMRTFDMISSMGLYSVVVLMVLGVVFSQVGTSFDISNIAAGLVWIMIVFASLMGLGRAFAFEKEQGCIDGLLLAPMDRSIIYLAKLTSNLLFISAVEVITLPLFYFLFLATLEPPETFFFSLIPLMLGNIGIAAVGTLLSTITVNTRSKDILLAVLFIPVVFPLLYACVSATTVVVTGVNDWESVFLIGVTLATGYDIIMALVSWLLYDYVISA